MAKAFKVQAITYFYFIDSHLCEDRHLVGNLQANLCRWWLGQWIHIGMPLKAGHGHQIHKGL